MSSLSSSRKFTIKTAGSSQISRDESGRFTVTDLTSNRISSRGFRKIDSQSVEAGGLLSKLTSPLVIPLRKRICTGYARKRKSRRRGTQANLPRRQRRYSLSSNVTTLHIRVGFRLLTVLRWQLIADHNERPNSIHNKFVFSLNSSTEITEKCTNLLSILPGLHLNILKTEKILQSWDKRFSTCVTRRSQRKRLRWLWSAIRGSSEVNFNFHRLEYVHCVQSWNRPDTRD